MKKFNLPQVIKKKPKNNKNKPKIKRKVKANKVIAIILVACISLGLIGGFVGLGVMFKMLSTKPDFDISLYDSKESSQIFDKNGVLVSDVGSQIRTNITYDDLPNSVVDAFVAVEDSRFFEHNGFDMVRFTKAMAENIKALRFAQGGSTISMQTTKMTYFMNDEAGQGAAKNVERKVQEIALALELEKNTNKKAILEMYINRMYYGGTGNIRGIEKAALYYFGKSVTDLNISESAMLAGIVNAPYSYDPFRHLDLATKRRNTVLYLMNYHGYITDEEYALAKSIKVEDLLQDPDTASNGETYAYQSYIDTVIREVEQETGISPLDKPMKIYTALDTSVQSVMDDIQAGNNERIAWPDELMETAMVSINNQTGEIIAIGGGRNYGRGGSLLLNHATQQYNQPGSSVKPILSYALAFEYLGWSTSHVVLDKPYVYRGTDIVVKNWNGEYHGQVTLMDAIGNSLNIPAISTLEDVALNVPDGRDKIIEHLQKLGFSKVTAENFDMGYAIGGSSFQCNLVELAGAHAVMFNQGDYIKPHTVVKIEYKDGTEPYVPVYSRENVISSGAAYLATQLMYEAVNGPYFNYMQKFKRDYATYGKTGTTDWGKDGVRFNIPVGAMKEKWMVSSTSNYTNAVWIGYEKGEKDKGTYFNSAKSRLNIPGNISDILMTAVNDELNPKPVTKPEDVTNISHILGTFPYATTIDGMDEKYIANGLIKTEFASNMVQPESASIDSISSFDFNIDENNKLNLSWGTYPNPDKLQVAPEEKEYGVEVNGQWISSNGAVLFDYSWLFGPIKYKAKVEIDGQFYKDIAHDQNTLQEDFKKLAPGTYHVKICGYYGYEKFDINSNQICVEKDITIEDNIINVQFPSATSSQASVIQFAKDYKINLTTETLVDEAKANTIQLTLTKTDQTTEDVTGKTISLGEAALQKYELKLTIYVSNQITLNYPSSSASLAEIQNFAQANNLTINVSEQQDNTLANTNSIEVNGEIVNGLSKTYAKDSLASLVLNVTIYTGVSLTEAP